MVQRNLAKSALINLDRVSTRRARKLIRNCYDAVQIKLPRQVDVQSQLGRFDSVLRCLSLDKRRPGGSASGYRQNTIRSQRNLVDLERNFDERLNAAGLCTKRL